MVLSVDPLGGSIVTLAVPGFDLLGNSSVTLEVRGWWSILVLGLVCGAVYVICHYGQPSRKLRHPVRWEAGRSGEAAVAIFMLFFYVF